MQFRNRHSMSESHVRIEECNFEEVFWRQNLIFCVEKCNFDEGIRGQNRILHRRMSILKEAVEARISFLHRKIQFRRRVLRQESHFCVKKSRSWTRLLRVPCRVGSVGRSPIRFFDLIREPSASFIIIIVVYGKKGTNWKWENMLLGQHDTLRTMYHEKSFRLHKNIWRGHQPR